jgi:hypothetical protein
VLEIDPTFPYSYEVEGLDDLPGTGRFGVPLIYFPPPKGRGEHDGLWLRVKANSGKAWIGVFAFGYTSPLTFSRVISSPNPNRVGVISEGRAYFVNADQPEVWEEVPVMPVLEVRPILEHNLLIFSDFIRLAAYGTNGLAWQSPRVCWDGLKITNITAATIEGTGHDPTNSVTQESRFVVDLKNGRSLLPGPVSVDGKPLW